MKRLLHTLLPLALILLPLRAADLFPTFDQLPKETLFPRDRPVTVSPDGDLLVNGKPAHLLGAQLGLEFLQHGFTPTEGYAPEHRWLYEQPLSYESSQRLGFDTFAWFIPDTFWLAKYTKRSYPWQQTPENKRFREEFLRNGLPGLIDVTCFPWTFGTLGLDKRYIGSIVPEEAVNRYHGAASNHWVPYNIMHPEGRRFYLDFWDYGCDFALANPQCQPLYFELFNEPAYDDPSPWNRTRFALWLQQRFGSIAELNRRWNTTYPSFEAVAQFKSRYDHPALSVAWGRMLEEAMTQLAADGRQLVRRKLPNTLVCFQILGSNVYRALPKSNICITDISRHMDAISLPTGGGISTATGINLPPTRTAESPSLPPAFGDGLVQRHLFRTIAGNRPIHNPECYVGTSRQSKYLVPWQDFLRGASATYLFCWSKRAWEWRGNGSAEGGKFIAEKMPYILANPFAHPTDSLTAFLQAKNDIAATADLFAPRANRPKAQTAILLSLPTERYAGNSHFSEHNDIASYANALEFTHHPYDVIPGDDPADFSRYRVLITVGARNATPETRQALLAFVQDGGILVAARQTLPLDEWGQPHQDGLPFPALNPLDRTSLVPLSPQAPFAFSPLLPGTITAKLDKAIVTSPEDTILATADGHPAITRRPLGKGAIYTIAPALQDYATAAVLDAILSQNRLAPSVTALRAAQRDLEPNLEIHLRQASNGLSALAILNLDNYPKLTDITLPNHASAARDIRQNLALNVSGDQPTIRLFIPANELVLIAAGQPEALQQRFGNPADNAPDPQQAYSKANEQHLQQLAKTGEADFHFHADSTQLQPINLRPFANSDFRDTTPADDGKGGWLDRGPKNGLANTPWELTPCLGIPCDFIRHDANDGKACIVLKSSSSKLDAPATISDIPVNARITSLFLFHGAANVVPDKTVMTYTVHYADGSTADIPIVGGQDLDDWTLPDHPRTAPRIAWRNSQQRGLYLTCWRNPFPAKPVQSLSVASANGEAIPFIAGITCERLPDDLDAFPVDLSTTIAWGQLTTSLADGILTVANSDTSADWAGLRFSPHTPVTLTAQQMRQGYLVFEINGGNDPFGCHKGNTSLQVSCPKGFHRLNLSVDSNPNTFQLRRIPLARWQDKSKAPTFDISSIAFQYTGTGKTAGFQLRNVRLEVPKAP